MNERIRKLAVETDAWCDQNWLDHPHYDQAWEEKFAELIVKDCMERLRQEGRLGKIQLVSEPYNTYKFAAMYDAAIILKDHFGIKE